MPPVTAQSFDPRANLKGSKKMVMLGHGGYNRRQSTVDPNVSLQTRELRRMLLQRLEALSYRPGRSTASGQPTYLKRLFQRFDANGDGCVSSAERSLDLTTSGFDPLLRLVCSRSPT